MLKVSPGEKPGGREKGKKRTLLVLAIQIISPRGYSKLGWYLFRGSGCETKVRYKIQKSKAPL